MAAATVGIEINFNHGLIIAPPGYVLRYKAIKSDDDWATESDASAFAAGASYTPVEGDIDFRLKPVMRVIGPNNAYDEVVGPETDPVIGNDHLLTEGGDFLTTEGGDRLILE